MSYNLTAEQDMIARSLRAFRDQVETYLKPCVNEDKKEVFAILFPWTAVQQANLVEMDINPLMITPDRCVAADVMIRETTI